MPPVSSIPRTLPASARALAPHTATLALITAVVLWGTSFVAVKTALADLPPLALVGLRMLIASALMAPAWRRLPQPDRRPGDRRLLLALVFLYPIAYFTLETNAITLTTASQAGAVTAAAPLLVAVGARLFLGERLGPPAVVGLAMATAGVVALSLGSSSSDAAPNPALGNLLELLALATYAAATLILRPLTARYASWLLTGLQVTAAAIVFLPAVLLTPLETYAAASPVTWAAVVYLGLAVTLLPIGLFNLAVSRMPAARAALAVNLVPVVAITTGWLLLGETLTLLQLVAAAAILGGVLVGSRR
jgi:drug/metabolite transporter (DMT)-like permease